MKLLVGDDLEWTSGDLVWNVFDVGRVVLGFRCLAQSTAFDVFADEDRHAWPPELSADELLSFETTWVASDDRVVVHLDYIATEFEVVGDIDLATEEDKTVFVVPFLKILDE